MDIIIKTILGNDLHISTALTVRSCITLLCLYVHVCIDYLNEISFKPNQKNYRYPKMKYGYHENYEYIKGAPNKW